MAQVIVGLVVAVIGQIMFFFIQKALDNWWNSDFHSSGKNTVP